MWATRAESPVRLERAAREGQDGAHASARQAQDLSALVTTALAAAAVLAQCTERAAGSLQQTAGAEQQIAETMKEIVASVQRVIEIVGGITTSVAEQSEGVFDYYN
jgi:methyl-accepting chemotaxis protein